jgi:hypothetical protein
VTALALAAAACPALAGQDRADFVPHQKFQALPGSAVGVLVGEPQAVLRLGGRSGPADAYVFSSDGHSYRWIYVPNPEKPQVTNLRVPVGDKGQTRTYPALSLANPGNVAQWEVKAPYALVRVQVNSGEGSPPGDSFVATEMKPLDGTKEYPLRVADVIAELRKRYAAHVKGQDKAVHDAMDAAQKKALKDRKPTGPRETQEVMYVTWLTKAERLRVHFRTRLTDGEFQYAGGGAAPAGKPPRVMPRIRYGTAFGVEYGMAYEVSKNGEVVHTEALPIETFRQVLPPPSQRGPAGPTPPAKKG